MGEFVKKHWSKFVKVHKHLVYTIRAGMLLYVAFFAIQHAFYAWAIAFVYFAFVDYYYNFNMDKVTA